MRTAKVSRNRWGWPSTPAFAQTRSTVRRMFPIAVAGADWPDQKKYGPSVGNAARASIAGRPNFTYTGSPVFSMRSNSPPFLKLTRFRSRVATSEMRRPEYSIVMRTATARFLVFARM